MKLTRFIFIGMLLTGLLAGMASARAVSAQFAPLLPVSCNWQPVAGIWEGNWSDPAHWDCGVVPGSLDSASLGFGYTNLDMDASVLNLTLNGGRLLGTGSPHILTVTGAFSWVSGQLYNSTLTLELAASSTTAADQNNSTDLEGARINNHGAFTLNHAQGISNTVGGGVINNDGVFNWLNGKLDGHTFNNLAGGTLNFNPGVGVTLQLNGPFNNAAAVNLQSGTLEASRGGDQSGAFKLSANATLALDGLQTFNFNPGTAFSGAGWLSWAGSDLEIKTNLSIPNLHVGFDGVYGSGGELTVTNNFLWDQGTLHGVTLTLSAGATGLVTNDASLTYLDDGSILNNHGTFTVNHTAGLSYLFNGATINNDGTFNLLKGSIHAFEFLNLPGGILNANLSVPSEVMDAAFINSGTLNALGGVLQFSGAFSQSAGATVLSGGGLAKTGPSTTFFFTNGLLGGSGALAGSVDSTAATLAPGSLPGPLVGTAKTPSLVGLPGALTISGDYIQRPNASLTVALAGAAPSTQYGVLTVGGAATLNGTLTVMLGPTYTPAVGSTFDVLAYSGHVGDFVVKNGLTLAGRRALVPTYSPGYLRLTTTQLPKLDQVVTFNPLPNKRTSDAPFNVSATASSGLPVTFVAAGPCTVSGARVTLTGPGICTITAKQGGSADYNPAPDLPRSFTVLRLEFMPVVRH